MSRKRRKVLSFDETAAVRDWLQRHSEDGLIPWSDRIAAKKAQGDLGFEVTAGHIGHNRAALDIRTPLQVRLSEIKEERVAETPAVDKLEERLDGIEARLDHVEEVMDRLMSKVGGLATLSDNLLTAVGDSRKEIRYATIAVNKLSSDLGDVDNIIPLHMHSVRPIQKQI